jgi:DnaA family protein
MKQVPLALGLEPPALHFPSTRQVPLALGLEPPLVDFASFVPAGNEALLQQLQQPGRLRTPVYLWGPRGCGKTHLLQGWLAQCRQRGALAGVFDAASARAQDAGPLEPDLQAAERVLADLPAVDPDWQALVVDDVHRLDAAAQQRLFAWLVEAQGQGVAWLAAGELPPVDLPLRDDLRSRLGWGAVYEVQPLADAHVRAVLGREASRRGFALGDEVADYLLNRFARDLPSLMRLLDVLDGYALARKRAVTVPLLREMLAEAEP